jgi:hypothetical protein
MRSRLTRTVTAALVAGAVFAPSAVALPDYPTGPSPVTQSDAAATPDTIRVPGPTVVVESAEGSGFDWGAFAIGAGGSIAIVLLAGGTALTTVRHRRVQAH